MSLNIFICMKFNFLKINSSFLDNWLSLVVHNNIEPKHYKYLVYSQSKQNLKKYSNFYVETIQVANDFYFQISCKFEYKGWPILVAYSSTF
jgi:hypothetical protein